MAELQSLSSLYPHACPMLVPHRITGDTHCTITFITNHIYIEQCSWVMVKGKQVRSQDCEEVILQKQGIKQSEGIEMCLFYPGEKMIALAIWGT